MDSASNDWEWDTDFNDSINLRLREDKSTLYMKCMESCCGSIGDIATLALSASDVDTLIANLTNYHAEMK